MKSSADNLIKILFIEDNPGDIRLVKEYLTESPLKNFSIDNTSTIKEANNLLKIHAYDLILLDLSLPDSDPEQSLINFHSYSKTPVIVLSGQNGGDYLLRFMRTGIQDFLNKSELTSGILYRSILTSLERHQNLKRILDNIEKRGRNECWYRQVIMSVPDAVLVLDKKNKILFANSSTEKIFKKSVDEIINTHFNYPVKMGSISEIDIIRNDGIIITVQMSVTETTWENDTVHIVSLRDVSSLKTDEKKMPVQISRENMNDDKHYTYNRHFLHDCKSNLGSIMAYANFLCKNRKENDTGKESKFANQIYKSSVKFSDLLSDNDQYLNIQNSKYTQQIRILELSDFLDGLLEEFSRSYKLNIVHSDKDPVLPVIESDAKLLSSILRNALVFVSRTAASKKVVFKIFDRKQNKDSFDTGKSDTDKALVFEICDVALESSQVKYNISDKEIHELIEKDLSLFYCLKFAEYMKYYVSIFCSEDKRALSITIPFSPIDNDSENNNDENTHEVISAEEKTKPKIKVQSQSEYKSCLLDKDLESWDNMGMPNLSGKKIMLVEDDNNTVNVFTSLFCELNAQVLLAGNGQECLDLLRDNPDSDIILMDLNMPVMSGYNAIREIRRYDEYKHIPIIVLTAFSDDYDQESFKDYDIQGYIQKPVHPEKVLSILSSWKERNQVKETTRTIAQIV